MNRKPKEHTMKKPNITPGPWRLITSLYKAAVTSGGLPVANIQACHLEPWRANATAIAALPDLLKALETSLAACEATQEAIPTDETPKAIREIRAALTKAGYAF